MKRCNCRWLLLPLALVACGDEQPLGIGSQLLPPDALHTFEVILEPGQYLVADTSFAIYGEVEDASFTLLARDYGGVLNSHEFARYEFPAAYSVTDSLGVARADSTPTLLRGEVVLYVDSLATRGDVSMTVALHALAESWDPATADWEFRSEGVRWSTPGGTTGALLDTALVTRDSIVLEVDSATLRQWADTTNALRGARLSLLAGPARMRAAAHSRLKLYMRTRFDPDTTFTAVIQAPEARIDYRPRLATVSSDPWISGVPVWRSFLQFRPDLKDEVVSCGPGCTVPLSQVSITRAELVLQPRTPPPGFDPELGLLPVAFEALIAPEFPLQRTPVGAFAGTVLAVVEPDRFTDDGPPVYLILTEFVRQMVADSAATSTQGIQGTGWIAIMRNGPSTVGIGTFAASPRLRLLLSTAREIQLP